MMVDTTRRIHLVHFSHTASFAYSIDSLITEPYSIDITCYMISIRCLKNVPQLRNHCIQTLTSTPRDSLPGRIKRA